MFQRQQIASLVSHFFFATICGMTVLLLLCFRPISAFGIDPVVRSEEQFSLEVIDAQKFVPTLPAQNRVPKLRLNPAITPVNKMCHRVWADGASVLVIRLRNGALTPGPVKFTLIYDQNNPNRGFNQPQFIGSLFTPGADPLLLPAIPAPDQGAQVGSLTANGGGAVQNGNDIFVYYRPPNNFMFGGQANSQPLLIEARNANNVVLTDVSFDLTRPMLVLGHGILGNSNTLNSVQSAIRNSTVGVDIRRFDYSRHNSSGYDTVAGLLHDFIVRQLAAQRRQGIAATRVDYFGYSLGGVVAKWYAGATASVPNLQRRGGFPALNWKVDGNFQSRNYLRDSNFGVGDFHRLISIGSPYRGSPLADLVVGIPRPIGTTAAQVIRGILAIVPGASGDGCCFDDLGTTSPATGALRTLNPIVPWFPVVGRGAPNRTAANLVENWIGPLLTQLFVQMCTNVGLIPDNGDLVVRDRSQINRRTDLVGPTAIGIALAVNQVPNPNQPLGLPRARTPGVPPPRGNLSFRVHTNLTHSDELVTANPQTDPAIADDIRELLDMSMNGIQPVTGLWDIFNPGF